MFSNWVLDAYNGTENDEVLLFYKGKVRQETIVELGEFLRNTVSESRQAKSLFSIFVELAHNILNHSDERGIGDSPEQREGVGILMVTSQNGKFMLSSGNLIDSAKLPELTARVDEIANLDRDEIRQLYRERRKSGIDRSNRGAGLGLLELALKSRAPLNYGCHQISSDKTMFCITVQISSGEEP